MKFKFKLFKLPKFPKLPQLKKIISPAAKHKFLTMISFSLGVFIILAMWHRSRLIADMKLASAGTNTGEVLSVTSVPDSPTPTIFLPSPTKEVKEVLGTSAYKTPEVYIPPYISPTPFPTFPPIPTLVPIPTTNPSSNNSPSTGNPNCTTGSGTANAWYSDVYPNPPITTNTGSVELVVVIRDCFKQTAPVSDTLNISLVSGNPNTKVNGNSLPVQVSAQNGNASFYVTSQLSGTVTLAVQDTNSNFAITDINNHNPTITFSGINNISGNSNCTTAAGVANGWYSDVYPTSPVSANAGSSAQFSVVIRDCNKNTVTSNENLTITQTSNDSGLTFNGSKSPVNITATNGQASFNVSSPNAGTVTFTVQDTSGNFTVTDANNHSQTVVFGNSSSPTSTPAPANSPTSSPTNSPTAAPTQSATATPTPTQSITSTPIPTPSPTISYHPT